MARAMGITPASGEWDDIFVRERCRILCQYYLASIITIVRQPWVEGKGLRNNSCTESHMPLVETSTSLEKRAGARPRWARDSRRDAGATVPGSQLPEC